MPLNSNVYVTLDEVKRQLGITDASQDDLLTDLINYATEYIDTCTGRTFVSLAYVDELYNGDHESLLFLRNFPVDSGETFTVKVDDEEITTAGIDFVQGIVDMDQCVDEALGNIKVTYTAGYATADTPSDLKQAVIDLVAQAKNTVKGAGIQDETVGDYSVSYATVSQAATPTTTATIERYKRR